MHMFTDIYVDLYKQVLVENMRETSTSTVMTSYYPPPIFFYQTLQNPKALLSVSITNRLLKRTSTPASIADFRGRYTFTIFANMIQKLWITRRTPNLRFLTQLYMAPSISPFQMVNLNVDIFQRYRPAHNSRSRNTRCRQCLQQLGWS